LEPHTLGLWGTPAETLLERYNLKLISIDRPGMGLSTFHEQRTLDSVAADVKILMQALGIEKCPVVCWSGGGPYALAFAHHHPELVSGVYIIAGFSASFGEPDVIDHMSWNKLYFKTARSFPLALKGSLALIKHVEVETPIHQELYDLSNPDYQLLKNVDKLNPFLEYTLKEASRASTNGPVQEAALYFEPFSFSLDAIQTPVHFWWGTEDNMVTYVHAKRLEQELPNKTPHYKPGEGHLSIYIKYFDEVLQTIAAG
jgi:pimeloyl-ACP methyl ester carboxylesterase